MESAPGRSRVSDDAREGRAGGGVTPSGTVSDVQELIEKALEERELTYTRHQGVRGGLPGLIVELPGDRRLKTNTMLSIGEHSVRVEAFVCRKPDENHEGVYRFLTTGEPSAFRELGERFLQLPLGEIEQVAVADLEAVA